MPLCCGRCVCASHPACVPTPCLECVHAAVHEYMSTWLPMSVPSPMHSFMESCVPLCVTVSVSQSPCLWSPSCLECVHASVHEFMSTWLPISCPAPMYSFKEKWVPLYDSVFLSQSPLFSSDTLFKMCTCIYVPLLPMLAQPPVDSYMET